MGSKMRWLGFAVLLPAMAHAQFDFGGGASSSTKPWDEFKLNPKTRIRLDYRNSSVDAILAMFQKTSGITIVKDPALTGQLTLTSAKAVPLADAFNILSTTLSLKNFELKKEGNLLIIQAKQQRGGGTQAFDPSIFASMGQTQSVLKVYPVQYANASQLARVLNEIFTPAGQGGFGGFGGFGGGGGAGGNRFGGGGGGGNRFGGGGAQAGGANPFAALAGRFGGQQQATIKASADDFSNSLIINAPDKEQGQVRDIIKQLDKPTDQPQQSRVYKLQYASSDDLSPVVQNILNANVPRGKGGASPTATQGPQAFFNAIRGTSAGSGQVVSDPRTNSLIVTATEENLGTVGKVVKELDTDIQVSSSTFVFPLNNARADSIASLIQQAFGTRQGLNGGNAGGRNATNTNGRVNNQNTGNRNNTGNNRAGGGGGLGGQNNSPNEMAQNGSIPLDLQNPDADSGELMTSVGVTQGFGQGFFGGQRQGGGGGTANNRPQTGRDEQGRLVNIRDLTGQVTAIPDINTNSLIVVTSPENAQIIRSILDQLDKIPEQVMIETLIVEASLDASNKLGVEWNFNNSLSKALGDPTGKSNTTTNFGDQAASPALQGLRYTISSANLGVFLNALQSDTKFQVLSTPRIFTSNNVQAQINISQSLPYVLNSRQDVNGNFTFNYAFLDVGIVLTVTPRITSNGYVTMDVTQTANDLVAYTDFNAPIVNQREADTTVSVKDGETIILGGIIRKTVQSTVKKIPLLGDLPLLGSLFRSSLKTDNKTELLVFLTPRIVRDPDEARKLKNEGENRLSPETKKAIDQFQQRGTNTPVKPGGGH